MKAVLLCGYFDNKFSEEVLTQAKKAVEYSANIYQEKLINGIRMTCDNCEIISAPFIGSFPNASTCFRFKGFERKSDSNVKYVAFNNTWGIRNISRAKALKQAMDSFIAERDDEKLIVVYSVHTPFIEAAYYAKQKDARIKICMVVPDLPQYMNLNNRISLMYRVGKKYDIQRFNYFNQAVDSYVFLTEPMADHINPKKKPCFVAEGIVTEEDLSMSFDGGKRKENKDGLKYILYAGKLNERFGVRDLVDAFLLLSNHEYRLVLCGNGDLVKYISEAVQKDDRIMYMGQLSSEDAKMWISKADVLVNPRQNNEEYTKYSFPSKNIEYLLTGKPVVGYMLDGMPEIYREFMFLSEKDGAAALADTIGHALAQDSQHADIKTYFRDYLRSDIICKKIFDMTM